jgi:hypothetical protein
MCTVLRTQKFLQDPQVAHVQFLSSLLHTTSDIMSLYAYRRLPCHHTSHIHDFLQTLFRLLPIHLTPYVHSLSKIILCPRTSRNKRGFKFSRTNTARKAGWKRHSYWMAASMTFVWMTLWPIFMTHRIRHTGTMIWCHSRRQASRRTSAIIWIIYPKRVTSCLRLHKIV